MIVFCCVLLASNKSRDDDACQANYDSKLVFRVVLTQVVTYRRDRNATKIAK